MTDTALETVEKLFHFFETTTVDFIMLRTNVGLTNEEIDDITSYNFTVTQMPPEFRHIRQGTLEKAFVYKFKKTV